MRHFDIRSKVSDQKRSTWKPRLFTNVQQDLPHDINLMAAFAIEGGQVSLQKESNVFTAAMFNASHSFANGKFHIGLNAASPLKSSGKIEMIEKTTTDSYTSESHTLYPVRRIACSFTYNFGNTTVRERSNRTNINEDDSSSRRNSQPMM